MTKVTVRSDGGLAWPARCARCEAAGDLTWANASSGRVTSVRPTLGGAVRVGAEMLDLAYPVCKGHSRGLALSNLLTRNTFGLKVLRGFVYLIGPMGLLMLLTMPLGRIGRGAQMATGPDLPWPMLAIYLIGAAALVLLIRAYRILPLRIDRQREGEVDLRFRNRAYAKAFVAANPDRALEGPGR